MSLKSEEGFYLTDGNEDPRELTSHRAFGTLPGLSWYLMPLASDRELAKEVTSRHLLERCGGLKQDHSAVRGANSRYDQLRLKLDSWFLLKLLNVCS